VRSVRAVVGRPPAGDGSRVCGLGRGAGERSAETQRSEAKRNATSRKCCRERSREPRRRHFHMGRRRRRTRARSEGAGRQSIA
jgi:hypothetical protein